MAIEGTLTGTKISYSCSSCKSNEMELLIDLGVHPVSNRFLKSPKDDEKFFKLVLGQCRNCALIQLIEHVPAEDIKPVYSWISYLEPESHLDDLASKVSKLPGMKKGAKLLGLSYKDASFLERLKKLGYESEALDIHDPAIVSMRGKADIVVARHILEHSYGLDGFISAMKRLVKPSGYIIVEVPDFEKSLSNLDYPAIWEEHISYFTEHTLKNAFKEHGLAIEMVKNYPYPMENCIVLIAKNSDKANSAADKNDSETRSELELGKRFKESFAGIKEGVKDFLRHNSEKGIAIMGAGHMGCAFVNYFGVGKCIKFFIDDNPDKKGLYMPGSKLEILNSSVLMDGSVKMALLSINPRNEEKCMEKNKQFLEAGGKFYSIFKNSSMPLPVFLEASGLRLSKKSEEVYYADDEIVRFSQAHVDFLKSNMRNSKTGRIRICAHRNPGDAIHEMLIMFDKKSYIRPHKHISKTESFHIIEGTVDVVLFDEAGNTVDVIRLSAQDPGSQFFYRLGKPQFHTVLVKSDYAIILETTQGPLREEDTIYAPWPYNEKNNKG